MDTFEESIISFTSFTSFNDPLPDTDPPYSGFGGEEEHQDSSLEIPVENEFGGWGNAYCVVS
jgi:hypothetical protein